MKLTRHIIIYFIEMIIVTTMIVFIFGDIDYSKSSLLAILKEYVFAFTFYQLVLISVFKLKDSLILDGLTFVKNVADQLQLFAEFNKKVPESVMQDIQKTQEKAVMKEEHRKCIMNLITLAENYNNDTIDREHFRLKMKQSASDVDFRMKLYSFHWMNSALLRIGK